METLRRSLAKALSYRIFSTAITMGVAWTITGSVNAAAAIGIADAVAKSALYYAHERAWNRINLGRVKPPEYQI